MSKIRKHLTTPKIEDVATTLGVRRNTLMQWRRRGVPYKARLEIMQYSNGRIKPTDFPEK